MLHPDRPLCPSPWAAANSCAPRSPPRAEASTSQSVHPPPASASPSSSNDPESQARATPASRSSSNSPILNSAPSSGVGRSRHPLAIRSSSLPMMARRSCRTRSANTNPTEDGLKHGSASPNSTPTRTRRSMCNRGRHGRAATRDLSGTATTSSSSMSRKAEALSLTPLISGTLSRGGSRKRGSTSSSAIPKSSHSHRN